MLDNIGNNRPLISHSFQAQLIHSVRLLICFTIVAASISVHATLSYLILGDGMDHVSPQIQPIHLTALCDGNAQTQYQFLVRSGHCDEWTIIRDYDEEDTADWTPTEDGYYWCKVIAVESEVSREATIPFTVASTPLPNSTYYFDPCPVMSYTVDYQNNDNMHVVMFGDTVHFDTRMDGLDSIYYLINDQANAINIYSVCWVIKYRYLIDDNHGGWQTLREYAECKYFYFGGWPQADIDAYNTAKKYDWVPNAPGKYRIKVDISLELHNAESNFTPGALLASYPSSTDIETIVVYPRIEASLIEDTPTAASLTAPRSVTIHATNTLVWYYTGPPPQTVEYQFMVNMGNGWEIARPYSTSDTFTWRTPLGDSTITVWAREVGSRFPYDAGSSTLHYRVKSPPSTLDSVWLSCSPPAHTTVNTPVRVTAFPNTPNFHTIKYKFSINKGGIWDVLRDFGPSNTFLWVPTEPGQATIRVEAVQPGANSQFGDLHYSVVDASDIPPSPSTTDISPTTPLRDAIVGQASADGRYIPYCVGDDYDNPYKIYVWDNETEEATYISDGLCFPVMSADGRFIAYTTDDPSLKYGSWEWPTHLASNSIDDWFMSGNNTTLYITDRETGRTERITDYAMQNYCLGWYLNLSFSADGRFISFVDETDRFVAGISSDSSQVYLYDRVTNERSCISQGITGHGGNDNCYHTSLTADGRYITFDSYASDLTANDTNDNSDIFLFNRISQQLELIKPVAPNSTTPLLWTEFPWQAGPVISADGRYIVFDSKINTSKFSICRYDRKEAKTSLITEIETSNYPCYSVSANGQHVVYSYNVRYWYPLSGGFYSAFLYDCISNTATSLEQVEYDNNYPPDGLAISGDGRYVAWASASSTPYRGKQHGPLSITLPVPMPFVPYASGAAPMSDGVNLATGEFEDVEGDIGVYNPVGPGASFTRLFSTYQAKQDYQSPGLPLGWVHGYDVTLNGPVDPIGWSSLLIRYPNGAVEEITPKGTGTDVEFSTPDGAPYTARGVPSATLGVWESVTLTMRDGSKWLFTPMDDIMPWESERRYLLRSVTNAAGQSVAFDWDPDTRQLRKVMGGGTDLLTCSYQNDELQQVTDKSQRTVTYTMQTQTIGGTARRCLTSACYLGTALNTVTYGYDGDDDITLLHTITGPNPNGDGTCTATINYTDGKVTSVLGPNGASETYTSQSTISTQVQASGPGGAQTSWVQYFDARNRDTGAISASGSSYSVNYADGGNTKKPFFAPSGITADGRTTTLAYDNQGHGNVLSVLDSTGTTTTLGYGYNISPLGLLTSLVESGKGAYSFTYTPEYALKTVTAPPAGTRDAAATPQTTTFHYDSPLKNLTAIDLPNGEHGTQTITMVYTDGGPECLGLPRKITDVDGKDTHIGYDDRGNVTSVTDSDGRTTDLTVNLADQLTHVMLPADPATGVRLRAEAQIPYLGGPCLGTKVYGANNTLRAETTSTHAFGANGETISTTTNGLTVSGLYDGFGRLKSLTDARGKVTTYQYNQDHLTGVTYPDNSTVHATQFDSQGRIWKMTDGNNVLHTYGYDDQGRMNDILADGQHTHWAIDDALDTVTLTDNTGTTLVEQHHDGSVKTMTRTFAEYPTQPLVLDYAYASTGQLTTLTTPAGAFTYTYLPDGKPATLTDPFGSIIRWQYADDGKLLRQTMGNGAWTGYLYDTQDRLRRLTHHTPKGRVLADFSGITYDDLDRCVAVRATVPGRRAQNGTTTYQYEDPENTDPQPSRLRQEQSTRQNGYTYGFSYDEAGNLLQFKTPTTLTYDDANKRTGMGFAYDGNGNPTTYHGDTLQYDAFDRLSSFGTAMAAGYDGNGLRAWKESGGGTTYYLYDGDAPVCELQDVGGVLKVTAVMTWGPTGLLSRTTLAYDTNGTLTGITPTWYAGDAQGNVALRLGVAGEVRSTASYDAWGNRLDGKTTDDPYGYHGLSGYYTDAETGLILCTYRYYDPSTGRWLTRDPIDYDGGLNLYEYCGGDPVGGEDASGLVTVHWVDGKPLLVFDTQSMGDAGKIAAAGLTFGAVNYKLSNGARATTDGAYKTSRNLAAAGYVAGAAAGGITVGTALATRIAAARAAAATATTVTTVASTPEGQHLVQHVIQHGWTFVNEHMSVRAQAYQMSVANVCIKMSYKIGNVKFDGADGMRLLEAKGPGYANFVNKYGEFYTWFRGNDALKNQMIRQADAAKSVGFTGVDWYVAEEKAYQAMLLVREKAIAEAPIVRDYINLILRKP